MNQIIVLQTALEISRGSFQVEANPDVGNDSHPWVSINALLNPTNDYDFYKVELQAGETITVDIDYGQSQGLPVDTYIRGLYNSNYGRLSSNDDTSSSSGGGGSTHGHDSYLQHTVSEAGIYYVEISAYSPGSQTGDYVLNLSIEPTPDSTGLGGGLAGNSEAVTIEGGDGADDIIGGLGNDLIDGGLGSDVLDGAEGDDTLLGQDGSDTLTGGSGSDVIDGGFDHDVAVFAGHQSDYTFASSEDGLTVTVTDRSTGDADTVTNVETLSFADGDIAVSHDGTGLVLMGQSADSIEVVGSVGVTVLGEAGNDTLTGGSGNDDLWW